VQVNYAVQESVIVIKNIFRKYPNRYESIISTLCNNMDALNDPEAKAAMVWIIGENSDRIDNGKYLVLCLFASRDHHCFNFFWQPPSFLKLLLTRSMMKSRMFNCNY